MNPGRTPGFSSEDCEKSISPASGAAAHSTPIQGLGFVPQPLRLEVWVILVAIWVICHRWAGLSHDGILYAAQAMLHVRPDVFAPDLFFAYGSQDDYTVFGRALAAAVSAIGFRPALLLFWSAGQILWFTVAMAWIRRAVPNRHVFLTAAVAFSLPVFYSSDAVLRFAEPFLTARSLAEPLALAGLLCALIGRRISGVMLLIAGAVIHPLMTIPAVVTIVLMLPVWRPFFNRPVAVIPVLVVGATLLLSIAGSSPKIDEWWLYHVAERSPFVVAGEWRFVDWVGILYPATALLLIALRISSPWREVWSAIAVCGFIGIGVAVLAWATRWEFGLQAQFWRFVWISAWAAPIAAIAAAVSCRNDAWSGRQVLIASTIPALAVLLQGWSNAAAGIVVFHLIALAVLPGRERLESAALRRFSFAVFIMLTTVAVFGGALVLYVLAFWPGADVTIPDIPSSGYALNYVGWLIFGWLAWRLTRGRRAVHSSVSVWMVAIVAVLVSGLFADGRSRAAVQLDHAIDEGVSDWDGLLSRHATVYWPEHLSFVWFALRRQSYVSRSQLAGNVFARGAAEEGSRRLANVREIGGRDAVLRFRNPGELAVEGAAGRAELIVSCSDPRLDFVVLRQEIPPSVGKPYFDASTGRHYFLHRCEDFRPGV